MRGSASVRRSTSWLRGDGELIEETARHDGIEAAETWAANLMIDRFSMSTKELVDLEGVWAETDGGRLRGVPPDPVYLQAARLILATRLLRPALGKCPELRSSDQWAAVIVAEMLLAAQLHDAGSNPIQP